MQLLEGEAQVAPLNDVLEGQREKTSVRVRNWGDPPPCLPASAWSYSQMGLVAADTFIRTFFGRWDGLQCNHSGDIPGSPVVKNLPCNAGDMGLIPGLELRFHMPQKLSRSNC